jgi:flagellar biosynthetic protein FliR
MVLVRMAGAFVFVPLPINGAGPSQLRVVLALACTFALYPRWPAVNPPTGLAQMFVWLISEAALGVSIGLAVSFISESLTVGAQMLSLQAGYGFASVVDPTTQADSGVLLVVAQLTAGLLFFATGLDHQVVQAFAWSLDKYPPGAFAISRGAAELLLRTGAGVFVVGLRIALPIIGLMLMTDIALALLGRINSQLQLVSLAFPTKMLLALAMLSTILVVFPALYNGFAAQVFSAVRSIVAR